MQIAEQARAQAASNANALKARQESLANQSSGYGGGGSLSAGLGATRADYMERGGVVACYDRVKGHMAKVTADTLEAKLKVASGLSPQQRQQWEEDVAAWRTAERIGADQAIPPDLDNPYRW